MSYPDSSLSPSFSINVSAEEHTASPDGGDVAVELLRQIALTQQQQTKLLAQLVKQTSAHQRARAGELRQWKEANPGLSQSCRQAAEILSEVQTHFIEQLCQEVVESSEHLADGDYVLSEFVDRFGPKMVHLNGVLQVLAQLGTGQPSGSTV